MSLEPLYGSFSPELISPSLDPLEALLKEELHAVNALILKRMESPVSLIPQLASHLINAGGKRIRPLLTLASARLCQYKGNHHIALATSVEFIHSATLLHDDVIDESYMRRNVISAHEIWGNQASVLVGDFLFSRAFQLMVEAESLEVLSILSQASATIAQGEVHQLLTSQNLETCEEDYLEVITAKTAKLFEAAAEIGAVLGERSPLERQALASFGRNLGLAFQLVDDVLDYTPPKQGRGKNVGDDFKEGKITLPVIWAFQNGSGEEKEFWRRTVQELDQKEGDLNQAIAYLARYKALEKSLEKATFYTKSARKCLDIFLESPLKAALEEVTYFVIHQSL